MSVLEPVSLRAMPDRPLVSIIVPSYNQGRFIRHTLDSILAQDYGPVEILVIDGASTDETVSVLRSYDASRVTWVSEPDRGVVDAVNKGFARARGDIIAIQSSDDGYLPGAIARVIAEFRRHPECGLVYGDTVKVDENGSELQRYRIGGYSLENLFLCRTWIPQPSAFFRRELVQSLGGWDERIPYAPDTDLWIRMAFRTEVRKVDAYLSERRVHGAQRDTQTRQIIRDYTRMIDQSPDLARAPAELRAAARASRYLIRVRYNPTGSHWYAAWNLFQAGRACAKCRNNGSVVRHLFYYPLRVRLSRTKRLILAWYRRSRDHSQAL
jgi:glycosyltransferase involved in cell wall biosynthesis